MKYVLGIAFLLLLIVGIYVTLSEKKPSPAFLEKISKQQNPFSVPIDSANLIWQRVATFIEIRKRWIGGGEVYQNDSILFIPYSNSYARGSSLRITKTIQDSTVTFHVTWWYSNELSVILSNELVYYMRTGIDRYHFNER